LSQHRLRRAARALRRAGKGLGRGNACMACAVLREAPTPCQPRAAVPLPELEDTTGVELVQGHAPGPARPMVAIKAEKIERAANYHRVMQVHQGVGGKVHAGVMGTSRGQVWFIAMLCLL
jgi:hypothetical protein